MDSSANVRTRSPWFGLGVFLLVVVLAIVFFVLASGRLGQRWHHGNRLNQPTTEPTNSPTHLGP